MIADDGAARGCATSPRPTAVACWIATARSRWRTSRSPSTPTVRAITAIVGESGSGKTTLARLLLGLVAPTSGQVLYQGRDLHALSGTERRAFRRDIQAIFQDPYGVYNPFYRVDHVLTTPVAQVPSRRARRPRRAA